MASLTDNLAVSLDYMDEYKDDIQTDTAPIEWQSSDVTAIESWFKPKQMRKLRDFEGETAWDGDINYPLGSDLSGPAGFSSDNDIINDPSVDSIMDDLDQESEDRLVLLAKKYASENVTLTKEDEARLEMINQKMDLQYKRYSKEDWELLDEAKVLIDELSIIAGVES